VLCGFDFIFLSVKQNVHFRSNTLCGYTKNFRTEKAEAEGSDQACKTGTASPGVGYCVAELILLSHFQAVAKLRSFYCPFMLPVCIVHPVSPMFFRLRH